MKKLIILIILLMIPSALALEECERKIFDTDVPCLVLLANITNPCNNIVVSFYDDNSTLLYTQTMGQRVDFMCNVTFNQTDIGTYTFLFNNSDTGTITVEEDIDNTFFLYVIAMATFLFFLGLGYFLKEPIFVIISGMVSCIIAINLNANGFPNLTNTFLEQMMVIIFAGIGFYLILAPSIEFFENLKGTFGGKME